MPIQNVQYLEIVSAIIIGLYEIRLIWEVLDSMSSLLRTGHTHTWMTTWRKAATRVLQLHVKEHQDVQQPPEIAERQKTDTLYTKHTEWATSTEMGFLASKTIRNCIHNAKLVLTFNVSLFVTICCNNLRKPIYSWSLKFAEELRTSTLMSLKNLSIKFNSLNSFFFFI